MTTEPWTVGRLLQWTADYLKSRGSDSPRLDAEVLLAEALNCQRIDLYTRFEETPGDDARGAFRDLVRRRAEGTPVAYLVGRREFYSLTFRVTPDVLIPRPETELLVVTALDLVKGNSPLRAPTGTARSMVGWSGEGPGVRAPTNTLSIADVGTGSGIIAVCLAKNLPNSHIAAIDCSPAALAVARQNARQHGVCDRIEFIESDLFSAVPTERRFDLVVSNPPYVTTAEFEQLRPDVRKFEPRTALVAGPKGTEVIERLLAQSAERLHGGGYLLIEIGPSIHDAVVGLITADARFEEVTTVKDIARHPRVVQARKIEANS